MRQEVLNWNRKKNGNHWKPFLEFFNAAPITDQEYAFILEKEKNNGLKNFISHSNSHFNAVRECLNSIYKKGKFLEEDLTEIDNNFLNGKKINFKGFLSRLEKYPISETTWENLIKINNTTGDFDKNKQHHIEQYNKIRVVANKLHKQDKYIKQEKHYFSAKKIQSDLDEQVIKSKKDNQNIRKNRLKVANKMPKLIQITSIGFKRNADVITEVLSRANGICERCNKNAPFVRKKDSTLYLEVHHKITLSDGGEDTIENAIALCPNCHRELHFGI